jgi:hypothetical protein
VPNDQPKIVEGELLARDLIAHQPPLIQVLSLPRSAVRRREEPGQGLTRLGELFRQAAARSSSSPGRSTP